jgi:hypothetical protein
MARRVKDYIEISGHTSLDQLISYLQTIRSNLPHSAEPQMQVRGDEVFGQRLSITYFRELTPEEAEMEARYSSSLLPAPSLRSAALRTTVDGFEGQSSRC